MYYLAEPLSSARRCTEAKTITQHFTALAYWPTPARVDSLHLLADSEPCLLGTQGPQYTCTLKNLEEQLKNASRLDSPASTILVIGHKPQLDSYFGHEDRHGSPEKR